MIRGHRVLSMEREKVKEYEAAQGYTLSVQERLSQMKSSPLPTFSRQGETSK